MLKGFRQLSELHKYVKGRKEEREEAAINLIKNGVSLEIISKSLGISIEELKKIKLN